MLEADVGVGEILGVFGGLVGEIVVPDERGEVLAGAGVVVDPESGGGLVGRGVRHGDERWAGRCWEGGNGLLERACVAKMVGCVREGLDCD